MKYKVSASIVISCGLVLKLELFIEVKNRSVYHVREEVLFREKADDDGEDEGVLSDYESEAKCRTKWC